MHLTFSHGATGERKDVDPSVSQLSAVKDIRRRRLLTASCRHAYVQSRLQANGRARRLSCKVQAGTLSGYAERLNESLPILLFKHGDAVMILDRRCSWAPSGLTSNGLKLIGDIPSEALLCHFEGNS